MNPNPTTTPVQLLALIGMAALASACAPGAGDADDPSKGLGPEDNPDHSARTAQVEGSVDQQGAWSGMDGAGNIASAVEIEARAEREDADALGTTTLGEDGRYALMLEPGLEQVLLQAIDGEGAVVGEAILAHSGEAEGSISAPPIDAESSVETEVLLQARLWADPGTVIDPSDVRARIDQETAAAIADTIATGGQAEAEVQALAEATVLAQATELEAYAQAGVSLSAATVAEAHLGATQDLDAALDSGMSQAEAEAKHAQDSVDALIELGLDPVRQAEAEAAAGAAFRLMLEARLDSTEATGVLEAAQVSAASWEAAINGSAVEAIMVAADAGDAALAETATARASLMESLAAAQTFSAAEEAWSTYTLALTGSTGIEGSLLGDLVGAEAEAEAAAAAMVGASAVAADELDAALQATIEAAAEPGSAVSLGETAAAVVAAHGAHRAEVESAGEALVAAGAPHADLAVSLTVTATGSLSGTTD